MSCNSSPTSRRTQRQRGGALLEFLFCAAFLWIPLFLGASQYGLALIQALRVSEACRDFGRMFAYGIDFSQSGNQYLLADTAPALNIDPTGVAGSGVVIFSVVQYVTTAQCQGGGYTSTCPNNGDLVFIRQLVVGNPSLHASAFGTPTTDYYGNVLQGNQTTSGYLNASNALVQNYPNITLSSTTSGQQYGYICEVYTSSPGLNWFTSGTSWVSDQSFF